MDSNTSNYSLIVLTPIEFLERLKISFSVASRNLLESTRCSVDIKFAENVNELIRDQFVEGGDVVDYVAIFVCTKKGCNIQRCQEYLKTISAKIVSTRLIIVNGTCRSGLTTATKELIKLCDEFRIPFVNAEIRDDTSCTQVAEKIVNLGAKVSGVTTGMPIIIPTPHDIKANLRSKRL